MRRSGEPMRTMKNKKRYGFTLIELMVVIAIMGILIIMGISSYKSTQMKSRDTRRKNDLRQVASALELYYNDKGKYPDDDNAGGMKGCGAAATELCAWGSIMKDTTPGKETVYMVTLPDDPAGSRQYYYDYDFSGKGYQLYARLENGQDIDLVREPGVGKAYDGTVCGSSIKCNYGVASTNLALTDNGHAANPE